MPPIAPFIPSIAKGVIGGLQSIFGGAARRRNEKDLLNFANSYQVSPGILDVYNKALSRYSANPTTSQYYTNQKRQIDRNMATGINAAQDRRSALSSIAALNQQSNDAYAKAGANAEGLQGQQLSQLSNAAAMKNQAEQKKFDMLYNIKAMKAGQAATTQNNGMQNVYGAIDDYSIMKYLMGGSPGGRKYSASDVTASNKPRKNLSYIPADEQLIP